MATWSTRVTSKALRMRLRASFLSRRKRGERCPKQRPKQWLIRPGLNRALYLKQPWSKAWGLRRGLPAAARAFLNDTSVLIRLLAWRPGAASFQSLDATTAGPWMVVFRKIDIPVDKTH